MIDCKECPDKMKCVTGSIKECRRGFKLKQCCRKYLLEDLKVFEMLIATPERMVKDGNLVINEVCGSCGEKLNINLSIKAGTIYDYMKFGEPNPYRDSTGPYTDPGNNTGSPIWTTTNTTGTSLDKGQLVCNSSAGISKPLTKGQFYQLAERIKQEV
jgi:hypothetical protein